MQRREAVRLLGVLSALPFLPATPEAAAALAERVHGAVQGGGFRTLDAERQRLVRALADAIIPETDTPGAVAVGVTEFIDGILTDWASPTERLAILAGLADIDARARAAARLPLADLAPSARDVLLRELDGERGAPGGAGHAFGRIKALTVYGYFTAESVQRDVLRTRMVFTTYEGCLPT